MLMMENAEEVQQALERFTKLKQTQIPSELEDYLCFVAKSGDTIFRWAVIKALFREKLIAVIKQFHEQTAIDDLPHYPNVDPFNYETMKTALLERLDSFSAAPFTVQRICELLTDPRKQYSRIDKFMRAIEKNILVVSTTEPGRPKCLADSSDYSDSLDSMVNGSSNVTSGQGLGDDMAGDIDVDIELENGAGAIGEAGATPNSAALPSINTLNSAILAATNQTPTTATADLLGHHQHHTGLNEEDVDEEDDDDDEDVVHNHLATDPAEEAVEEPGLGGETAAVKVATEAVEGQEKVAGKKRPEEDEDEAEAAKRVKLGEREEAVEEQPETTTIPEKEEAVAKEQVSSEAVAVVPVEEEKAPLVEGEATCEKEEAKDLQGEEVKAQEESPATPVSEAEACAAVPVEAEAAAVIEGEVAKNDAAQPEPVSVIPPAEPIVADAEKDSLSPPAAEEAMDDKPIESAADAMEAESTPIAASEMDVDSSEGVATTGAAVVSEESVSMDEPMEDQ